MHKLSCYERLSSNDMLSLITIRFIINFHLRLFLSAIKSLACTFTHNFTKISYVLIMFCSTRSTVHTDLFGGCSLFCGEKRCSPILWLSANLAAGTLQNCPTTTENTKIRTVGPSMLLTLLSATPCFSCLLLILPFLQHAVFVVYLWRI